MSTQQTIARTLPKYVAIAERIRRQVLDGSLRTGQQIGSTRELASVHHTTKVTISQALDHLESLGVIERRNRRGIFVSAPRLDTLAVVFNQPVFTSMSTSYHLRLNAGLHQAMTSRRWNHRCFVNVASEPLAREFIEAIDKRQFDALVLASNWVAENCLPRLRERGIPVAAVYPYPGVEYCVTFDYLQAYRAGAEALAKMGCRRPAFIGHTDKNALVRRPDVEFSQAAEQLGMEIDPKLFCMVNSISAENGFHALNGIWAQRNRPDGLLIDDEVLAQGVIKAIVGLQIDVPGELKLVSQTSEENDYHFALPVVRLRTPVEEQVQRVAEMVDDLRGGRAVRDKFIKIPPVVEGL